MKTHSIALGAAIIFICAPAFSSNSSAPQNVSSKIKSFMIEPKDSDQAFMCESGQVQSVLATAISEHRVVSIVFVDRAGTPIPQGVWSNAYGFRLLHRQEIIVQAAIICGN